MTNFNQIGINQALVDQLARQGITAPTPVQEQTIPVVLQNKNVVVRSQTGSGKTLAFLLPLLQNLDLQNPLVQILVVSPTRELAMQVKDEISKLKPNGEPFVAVTIVGGADIGRQISGLKKSPQIVVGTPGRLIDHLTRRTLKLHGITHVVLDEADEMLNMGFQQDIEKILGYTPKQKQILLFSATFPKEILSIINQYVPDPVHIQIGQDNQSLTEIQQHFVYAKSSEKMERVWEVIEKLHPQKCIIFCNTKSMAQNLGTFLSKKGLDCQSLHGDLRQSVRKKVLNEMKTGKVNFLVASDVAARGLDISDIDYVFNYDVPHQVEYYLHRIGRTARCGKNGNAITFISTKNQYQMLKEYEQQTQSHITELFGTYFAPDQKMTTKKQPEKVINRFNAHAYENKRTPKQSDRRHAGYSTRFPRKENHASSFTNKRSVNRFETKSDDRFSSPKRDEHKFAHSFEKRDEHKTPRPRFSRTDEFKRDDNKRPHFARNDEFKHDEHSNRKVAGRTFSHQKSNRDWHEHSDDNPNNRFSYQNKKTEHRGFEPSYQKENHQSWGHKKSNFDKNKKNDFNKKTGGKKPFYKSFAKKGNKKSFE